MASGHEWSDEEIKLFNEAKETHIKLFDEGEWDEIAKLIPTKTAEKIKLYYELEVLRSLRFEESQPQAIPNLIQMLKEDVRRFREERFLAEPVQGLRPPNVEDVNEFLSKIEFDVKETEMELDPKETPYESESESSCSEEGEEEE